MDTHQRLQCLLNRRHFLQRSGFGLATAALASLAGRATGDSPLPGRPPLDYAPTAKRVIYLFQSGGPSQIELFDYKPQLARLRATELPDSVRQGQRITTMTSGQDSLPIAPSLFSFAQHGDSGA